MHAGRARLSKPMLWTAGMHSGLRWLLIGVPWFVSMAWLVRSAEAYVLLKRIPDLLQRPVPAPRSAPEEMPLLSVVVPACNEEQAIEATIRALLASKGVPVEVIAINDRSTDETGAILDRLAAEEAAHGVLRVLHIRQLPAGWLGKPHALAEGVALARAPYLLFTDADILFRQDALARALDFFIAERLDHLILASTPITRTVGERIMISTLQALSIWPLRLWRVSDPTKRESLGVGSFGMVSRKAYEKIGGWSTLRMEVLEDIRFGWEIKRRHHLRQQVAVGRGLLRLHWAAGAFGLAHNLTKNGFAMFRYRLPEALVALAGLAVMLFIPILALAGPFPARFAVLPFLFGIVLVYRRDLGGTGISAWYALLFPIGAALMLYAMARSIVFTLLRGGVQWRGTFYPLEMLRRAAGPVR